MSTHVPRESASQPGGRTLKIIAIGGGEIKTLETLPIDKEIVSFTGLSKPRALFIPTASDDAAGYCETFRSVYGTRLGCLVEYLLLAAGRLSSDVIHKRIAQADLIYVGGGNTRRMLDLWRQVGVDLHLREAAQRGAVLSGLSAGALCWFQHGNSDAPLMEGRTDIKTMRIDGLGLVNATLCPHFTSEPYRRQEFSAMMLTTPGVGLALDDACALQIHGDAARIISRDGTGHAHLFTGAGSSMRTSRLSPSNEYRPLSELGITPPIRG